MIGRMISRYRITAKLGEGGMGAVYKAEDTVLKRLVALKFLRIQSYRGDEGKAKLLLEARAAASLNHPNICTIYEVAEVQSGEESPESSAEVREGTPYLAMEFVDGQPLSSTYQGTMLPVMEDLLKIAIQIAEGLQTAERDDHT
jgi:serine/threonine protein kinase